MNNWVVWMLLGVATWIFGSLPHHLVVSGVVHVASAPQHVWMWVHHVMSGPSLSNDSPR